MNADHQSNALQHSIFKTHAFGTSCRLAICRLGIIVGHASSGQSVHRQGQGMALMGYANVLKWLCRAGTVVASGRADDVTVNGQGVGTVYLKGAIKDAQVSLSGVSNAAIDSSDGAACILRLCLSACIHWLLLPGCASRQSAHSNYPTCWHFCCL